MRTKYILLMLLLTALMAPIGVHAQDDGGISPPSSIELELIAEGMAAPIDLAQPDDGTGRFFVADQTGQIYVIDGSGQLLDTPLLDISGRLVELSQNYDERGLLGMALHPNFAENGRFFVYYSAPLRDEAPEGWNNTTHLSEFTISSDNMNQANADSERVLMRFDQPQFNHEGGDIAFGSDGMLYVPLGDGGGADDVGTGHTEGLGNGQDLSKLLGKILRIDVDSGDPYAIPEDNPFVGDENVPGEIWAYGFRNPWRISYDDEYGWFVADLGQNVWEEVNIVSGGNNYGWNIMEASHCFSTETPDHNPLDCEETGANGEALQLPIIEYSHQLGISIIGGYVYRGEAIPSMQGAYVFGDWSTSFDAPEAHILAAVPAPGNAESHMWKMQTFQITNTGEDTLDRYILSFGQDNSGEIYVLTSNSTGPSGDTGQVWRIAPGSSES